MPDTDPNLTIDVSGTTGSIATEWVTSGGITNAHVQIVKLAWGDTNTATRVKTSSPLPVTVISNSSTLGVSGTVFGAGNFKIINGVSGATLVALTVQGTTASGTTPVQISGNVQGVTNGIAVGVTGSVTVANSSISVVGVSGGTEIGITGGRRLNYVSDSVTVQGTVGVSGGRYLLPATDGVKVYSSTAGTTIPVQLWGSGGAVGMSGTALNVNLVGAGITASVTMSAIVGISQADSNVPLYVAGATAGPAVRVKGGLSGGAVEVGWSNAMPVTIDSSSALNLTFQNDNIVTELTDIQTNYLNNIKNAIESINTSITQITGKMPTNQTYTTNTNIIVPSSVYSGTVNLTSGGGNVQLPAKTLKNGMTVKNMSTATGNQDLIQITPYGLSGPANAYLLSPGEILFLSVNNTNSVLFAPNGSINVSFCYIAS
jgi:hypothetical protein